MRQTLATKLLASHALVDGEPLALEDQRSVRPGAFLEVRVDRVLANDITAPLSIREFAALEVDRVFDPKAIVLVADHFTPCKDIASAAQCAIMRRFADEQGLEHFYDVGQGGIEHVLLPERGLVLPGDVIIGADSHTCTYGALGAFATGMGSTDIAVAMATGSIWMRVPETVRIEWTGELQPWVGGKDLILHLIGTLGVDGARYRVLEFAGPVAEAASMDARFTIANMAIEAGAKAGLFCVDPTARAYVAEHVEDRHLREYVGFRPDADAEYAAVLRIDVGEIAPLVAAPHLPSNIRAVGDLRGVSVDQVVIGSCTNGRLEDLRVAAGILRGRKVQRGVRCIVLPGSQRVALAAVREGLTEIFLEAGAVVSTPTCGPCLGGHMGVLAAGQRAISTTNRNFRGRMGHAESEVYLAGPAVAAASAVTGAISSPEEVMG